jgi:hypothetical protein
MISDKIIRSWWKKEEQKDEKQHQEFMAKLAREPPGDNPSMLAVKKKLELNLSSNLKSCENLVKKIREETERKKLLKELVAADLEKIEEVAMPGDDEPPQEELLAALPVPAISNIAAPAKIWSCHSCSQQEMAAEQLAASLSNIEAIAAAWLKLIADAKDPQPLKKKLKLKKRKSPAAV